MLERGMCRRNAFNSHSRVRLLFLLLWCTLHATACSTASLAHLDVGSEATMTGSMATPTPCRSTSALCNTAPRTLKRHTILLNVAILCHMLHQEVGV